MAQRVEGRAAEMGGRDSPRPDVPDPPPRLGGRVRSVEAWLARHRVAAVAALFAVLLIPCSLIVGIRERDNQPLFIIDEFAYADYLHKVHDGQLVIRRGELIGPETLRELACRGHSSNPDDPERQQQCGMPRLDPAAFPNAGVNSADVHPPTYFVVTDIGARIVMATGFTPNLIRAGRLFGAAWMAAGLTALWYLARMLGARRGSSAAAVAAVGGGISLQWQWHYLTPDAPNILIGALVALAVLRWERSGRGLALVALAAAVAMSIKAPNVLVVAAMALYLLGRAAVAHRGGGAATRLAPRAYLLATTALVGGAGAVSVAWLIVRRTLATSHAPSEMDRRFASTGLQATNLTENIARFLGPWDGQINRTYQLSLVLSYVIIGSIVAALLVRRASHRDHTLAAATAAVAVLGPLLLVVIIFVTSGTYFPIEPRYGTSIVPLEAAVAATVWRRRGAIVAIGAFVAVYHVAGLLVPIRA